MENSASYSVKELTKKIKKEAFRLGFQKVGIAKAERLDEEQQHLSEWLARGYHGTMNWMERNFEKRIDPREILPGSKSIIVVGINYYTPVQHNSDPSTGKISRYAWGNDYHEIVGERLTQLVEFIKSKKPDASTKIYVDTGPVMEKAWAERAGIGWRGKHTNVITQDYGSWIFLGEIITDIELEYDTPATDHCGTCTLCIEACPTQAIVEPYVLDASRCISYLTIEHRGEISNKFSGKFENWIYGCDICQDVCPWNQKYSQVTEVKEFYPRERNVAPKLEELTSITQEDFSKQFRKSPMKRTKRDGLARNAEFVLSHETKES